MATGFRLFLFESLAIKSSKESDYSCDFITEDSNKSNLKPAAIMGKLFRLVDQGMFF